MKRKLSLILIFAICLTFIPFKGVYASYRITATPETVTTNKTVTKVTLPTFPVDSYVLYTSVREQNPDVSEMWRIPANHANVQDYNICGTWYLHVYIPSTGDRKTFGPYQKEVAPPPIPMFEATSAGIFENQVCNVSFASFKISSKGDEGSSESDTINHSTSYFESGYSFMEIYDNDKLVAKTSQVSVPYTVTEKGPHVLKVRATDKVGNVSEWGYYRFTLGEGELPPIDPENPDPDDDFDVSSLGVIKFDPNECDWTNEGKTGEGEGEYPVEVYYDGDNPHIVKGTATEEVEKEDDEGNVETETKEKSIPVEFPLDHIDVTGDAEDTVDGDRGTIYIEKEGEGLTLHGEGFWGDPEYDDSYDDVDYEEPDNPTGDSGEYNIDWTRPEISVDPRPKKEWRNDTLYNVDVNIYDELSGIDTGTIELDDISHYKRDDTVDIDEGGNHDFSHTFELDDGIYSIYVEATDIATNDYDKTFKTYYIDGTDPEIDFNIEDDPPNSTIFSVANNAIRKPSVLGCDDGFFGKLTAKDNLSGVKSIQYKWTYSDDSERHKNGYTRIYTSEDTYYDRYEEVEENEIEKPVGDHLFLHVEVYDVSENYTYKCFGPYEDPIKLRDFQVTDIRDPRWTDVFWEDDSYTKYKNVKYKVNRLPIDQESHPTLRNAYPKKGYAFYFDITSEYLYREADRIEVTPSFYYINNKNERIPLDLYYNNANNPLIQPGSSKDNIKFNLDTAKYGSVWIGGIDKLTLTKGVRIVKGREWAGEGGWKGEIQYCDGKIQWWYGKYLIPATSIFVKQGDSPRPENVFNAKEVIVNFQIVAYKNGIETLSLDQIYTYVPNQWTSEGGPKNNSYKPGDVIVYDNKYSALSDYNTYVIQ